MAIVFFSYSHKDEALRDELESHLALLKNEGLIEAWYDRRIVAGDEIDDTIFSKLEVSDLILLLVSSDFLGSPYCYSREMKKAMERHESGEARVIPIILRHCDWKGATFGKLMAAPRDGKPVTAWADRDEAFADIAKQVRRAVESSRSTTALTPEDKPAVRRSAAATTHETAGLPRSSNLRLKKQFTEKDQDDFLRSTFEFVCRFFEGSVGAIGERNPDVTGTFDRIDSRRMAAVLYRGGKKIAECSVRLDGLSRSNGIAFSHDSSVSQGSFNELLSVKADDHALFLKPMGMGWGLADREQHLSQEGASEFLWGLFVGQAQR